jgi:hypothetical protein
VDLRRADWEPRGVGRGRQGHGLRALRVSREGFEAGAPPASSLRLVGEAASFGSSEVGDEFGAPGVRLRVPQ